MERTSSKGSRDAMERFRTERLGTKNNISQHGVILGPRKGVRKTDFQSCRSNGLVI